MAIIYFAQLTKKHLLFLGFIISSFGRFCFKMLLIENVEEQKLVDATIYVKEQRYFDIITNVSCDLLTGILHFLQDLKRKNEYKKLRRHSFKSNSRSRISIDERQNLSIFSFKKIILIISSIDFICQLLFLIFTLIYGNDGVIPLEYSNIFLLLDISARYLFSLLILKTYFYRHHYFSFFINIITLLILGSIDLTKILKIDQSKEKKITYAIFSVIQTVLYSLEDVLNKVALSKEPFTPYSLLFYKGFYQTLFFILPVTIIMLFFSGGSENNENYSNIFDFFYNGYFDKLTNKKKLKEIICRILYGICNMSRSIFLVYVIDVFSSQHLSVLRILESLLIFIYLCIQDIISGGEKYKSYEIVIYFLCYGFLVFTSFIHNEIMIINLFGLQKFTEQGLQLQAKEDLYNAMNDNTSMSDEPSANNNISENASFNIQNISADYD